MRPIRRRGGRAPLIAKITTNELICLQLYPYPVVPPSGHVGYDLPPPPSRPVISPSAIRSTVSSGVEPKPSGSPVFMYHIPPASLRPVLGSRYHHYNMAHSESSRGIGDSMQYSIRPTGRIAQLSGSGHKHRPSTAKSWTGTSRSRRPSYFQTPIFKPRFSPSRSGLLKRPPQPPFTTSLTSRSHSPELRLPPFLTLPIIDAAHSVTFLSPLPPFPRRQCRP